MKRLLTRVALVGLALSVSGPTAAQNHPATPGNLNIYWIDVEGGAATLFVSPSGESMLFDTGYPDADRDATRIHAVARMAGLTRIDHVVISHWHGDGVEPVDRQRLEGYKAVAGAKRTIVHAGDTIPFGSVQVRVVVSEGPVIATAINGGGPNPLCANAARQTPAGPENQRMVGLSLTYGGFTFASLADLDWQRELELACPINKLGRVTVYTVNRHGGLDNSGTPALLGAITPQVIVVNNGPRKGLGGRDDRVKPIVVPGVQPAPYEPNSYLRMAKTRGVEDVWQGHWIAATVARDGRFTVTNGRNGFRKTYPVR